MIVYDKSVFYQSAINEMIFKRKKDEFLLAQQNPFSFH